MLFGVREICDVVLKKKAPGYFGKLYLSAGMPALYFDSLKTSSLEGAATTVYAQGGKGNPRLIAWEGDKTLTFTMEDALLSPQSFSILSGAGLMDAAAESVVYVHMTQQAKVITSGTDRYIVLDYTPAGIDSSDDGEATTYLMAMTDAGAIDATVMPKLLSLSATGVYSDEKTLTINGASVTYHHVIKLGANDAPTGAKVVFIDYYVKSMQSVKQIDIEAAKFGGSYYLEASTLFRDQATGEDYPAEFVIPNCKVQSNFTFTMAATGDPSTFTFTMDAFPDYTKFDKTKKVMAAIQIVEDKTAQSANISGSHPFDERPEDGD